MKRAMTAVLGIVFTVSLQMTAFAGAWKYDAIGWWYQNDDGSYQQNGWFQDMDGKYYYFNGAGYMLAGTVTPDGYYVGTDGAWDGGDAAAYKSPEGTFYINGNRVPTMPETYPDAYFHSVVIEKQESGDYLFIHIIGRHQGGAILGGIRPNTPTRYESTYKGSVSETGIFVFDGSDIIRLREDGTDEELIFVRGE